MQLAASTPNRAGFPSSPAPLPILDGKMSGIARCKSAAPSLAKHILNGEVRARSTVRIDALGHEIGMVEGSLSEPAATPG